MTTTTRRRRRRTHGPARCQDCRAPIRWLRLRGEWRPFNPKPVDPRHQVAGAYPVENRTAWPLEDLVVELMGRRNVGEAEARDEALDLPWHTRHICEREAPE